LTRGGRGALPPRPWLLYGAYGFTGRLLAEEALRRGHRPILAGRDEEKLRRLVAELTSEVGLVASDLEGRVLGLDEPETLRSGIADVHAVLHAAGPFVETGEPMMAACLEAGCHYLDITGEVPVFEEAFRLSDAVRERGLVFMPGVGMDVIPTDGVAALLADRFPSARRLELALHSPGRPSAGTLKTVVEGVPGGLLVRREGRLLRSRPGRREFRRWVDMGPSPEVGPMAKVLGGRQPVSPYTWGDLATAWRTTGIDHVTCYMVTPRWQARALPLLLPIVKAAFSARVVRRWAKAWIDRGPPGPGPERRRLGRTRVWGRVEDDDGRAKEVVLEFAEAYRFTAMAGVRALEEVLSRAGGRGREGEGEWSGTLTPAGAFGSRWVLGLPEVEVVTDPHGVTEGRN
jgi:short subunit dehydrogenase-like uncharacterized protein